MNGRVAVTAVGELPIMFNADAQRAVVERVVAHFEELGHPTVAAIHRHPQPHFHLLTTARRARLKAESWETDGEGVRGCPMRHRLLATPADVKKFRSFVADQVNAVAIDRNIEMPTFHPGRLRDTGIDRPAKSRLPEAEYYRKTLNKASPVRRINGEIDAGDHNTVRAMRHKWQKEQAAERARRKDQKRVETTLARMIRLERQGWILTDLDERKLAEALRDDAEAKLNESLAALDDATASLVADQDAEPHDRGWWQAIINRKISLLLDQPERPGDPTKARKAAAEIAQKVDIRLPDVRMGPRRWNGRRHGKAADKSQARATGRTVGKCRGRPLGRTRRNSRGSPPGRLCRRASQHGLEASSGG